MVCLAPPAARRMSTELFRGWEKLAQTPESLDALRRVQPSAPLLTWPLCRVWSSCGGGLLVLEAASGEQLFTGPGPLYAQKRLLLGAGEAWLSPPLAPTPGAIPTRDIWSCFQLARQGRRRVSSWMDSFCGPRGQRQGAPRGRAAAGWCPAECGGGSPAQRSWASLARTTLGSFL